MAKKQRGRPRKDAGQAKSHLMQIRISPAEKQAFEEAAARTGEALSVWVRGALRRAAQVARTDHEGPAPQNVGADPGAGWATAHEGRRESG